MLGYVEIQLDNKTMVSDEAVDAVSLQERAGAQMRPHANEDRRRSKRRLVACTERRKVLHQEGAVDQIVEGHTGHEAIMPEVGALADSPM
ncbi:MAG: hypothetical protein BMS9Abin07_2066 [Acidimicrobiia bacterium]|nr:MAG: hypothetical protein BMS9Abin07_2066 [Acidimicrobiia bacterium]